MGIFKAYDIRGVYGQELTDDIFYKIARAYARFLGAPKKIVVARDIRPHSEPLFAAFARQSLQPFHSFVLWEAVIITLPSGWSVPFAK